MHSWSTNLFGRTVATVAVFATCMLASSAAFASSPQAGETGRYRAECRKLTKQIDHYENTILPMAEERGNDAWGQATEGQITRLWHRRADLCPAYGRERTMIAKAAEEARKFNELVALAGKAAVTYFTGGLGGVIP